ncbi:hypothetical protein RVX52_003836 [Enterobacter cloacae]|nr:hypothetical protein [Enterobacter cloacae]
MLVPFRASMRYAHTVTGCALLARLTANHHGQNRSASNSAPGARSRCRVSPAFRQLQLRPATIFCWHIAAYMKKPRF